MAHQQPPLSVRAEFFAPARIDAAPAGKRGPRRFKMLAYTGAMMRPNTNPPLPHPVVVDLASMDLSKQRRPALRDHDFKRHVGHTTRIRSDGRQLTAEGVVSGVGDDAKEVVEASDNEFEWQVSMGAQFGKFEFVEPNQRIQVNGRTFSGPVYVARQGWVRELSFLTLGADDDTRATITASLAEKDSAMTFEQWLDGKGIAAAELTDAVRNVLNAQYEVEAAAATDTTTDGGETEQEKTVEAAPRKPAVDPAAKAVNDLRRQHSEELRRIGELNVLAAKYDGEVDKAKVLELHAQAIEQAWDNNKFEVELLRARRPAAPKNAPNVIIAGSTNLTSGVIEAGFCLAAGLDSVEKSYDAKTLEAADKRFRRSISLQEVLLEAAWANGYTGRNFKTDPLAVQRYAFGQMQAGGGASSIDVAGILSNTANKFLLEGFMHVEDAWRQISTTRPVSDFKTITSYRLTGSGQYEKVGPDGSIKHGTLGEESFTNSADTYGLMLSITRRDMINDDLGAFTAVPRKLGRGAGLKLNDVFWTAFLDNSTFFTSARANYFEGAATNLQSSSLKTAVQMFRRQTDADGKPLGVDPKILLVGPENEVTADELYTSTNNNTGGSSTTDKVPNRNVFAGKYTPVVSAYLSNSSYTGYSTTAWYLLASPADLSAIEVAFLNGQQSPTIETADADFSTLGIQLRGYHDFGVSKQDYRAGTKSKGAA